jgi:hypothetical protein
MVEDAEEMDMILCLRTPLMLRSSEISVTILSGDLNAVLTGDENMSKKRKKRVKYPRI